MKKMGVVGWIAFILVFVGGLNWGLVGAFNYNLVESVFGTGGLTRTVYVLVGLAALYLLIPAFRKGDQGSVQM